MTADVLTPHHPLEAWRAPFAALPEELGDRLTVTLASETTAFTLRLPPSGSAQGGPALRAAADALGGSLPVAPGSWSTAGSGRAPLRSVSDPDGRAPLRSVSDPDGRAPLRSVSGPDGRAPLRSVSGPRVHRLGPDEWLVTRTGPTVTEQALTERLRPHGGAAIEVSAQRTGLELRGSAVRDLLAFGCSLDLRPHVLTPGRCAQTAVWQAPTLLTVTSDGIDLLVRTSFARHLAARLLDAARGLPS